LNNEALALVLFAVLAYLFGSVGAAPAVPQVGANEIYLAFALVFTFAVGLEVIK
jgi:hypothetical protein